MYQLTLPIKPNLDSNIVIRLSDNAYIPMNEANTDYQAYLKWLSEGGVPLPADEVTE